MPLNMAMSNSLIDIPVTQYYFDTFVIGAHHSLPHLVADLVKRKRLAEWAKIQDETPPVQQDEYDKLIQMIDEKLSTINIEELADLELSEPAYWVNELARRSAIEINTYGRIRPDTLSLLLCISEEDFGTVMRIASNITQRLKLISDLAEASSTPVPEKMPRQL